MEYLRTFFTRDSSIEHELDQQMDALFTVVKALIQSLVMKKYLSQKAMFLIYCLVTVFSFSLEVWSYFVLLFKQPKQQREVSIICIFCVLALLKKIEDQKLKEH